MIKFLRVLLPLLLLFTKVLGFAENRLHEVWWEQQLKESMWNTFANWLGDIDAPSRVLMRKHVRASGYSTILDAAAGLCTDYFGLKKYNHTVQYTALDITPKLVKRAKDFGISIVLANIENIPFEDSSFDLCQARHILEHLSNYPTALNELIRVASKEVFVIFFISPSIAIEDNLVVHNIDGYPIYHNEYSQPKLETFLLRHPKVSHISWEPVEDSPEYILHIYLQNS